MEEFSLIYIDIVLSRKDIELMKLLRGLCKFYFSKVEKSLRIEKHSDTFTQEPFFRTVNYVVNFVEFWWMSYWLPLLKNKDYLGVKPTIRLLNYASFNNTNLLERLCDAVKYEYMGDNVYFTHIYGVQDILFKGGLLKNAPAGALFWLFDLAAWSVCVTRDKNTLLKLIGEALTHKIKGNGEPIETIKRVFYETKYENGYIEVIAAECHNIELELDDISSSWKRIKSNCKRTGKNIRNIQKSAFKNP